VEIIEYNLTGGYNPYLLKWDDTVSFPSTRKLNEYGNRIYNRYPARSIFLVPRATIYSNYKNKPLNILDPFMGSGTTAVEASIFNCNIFGTEMDPFARLISEVSILRFDEKEVIQLEKLFKKVIANWKIEKINYQIYPKLKNIEYWFDKEVFYNLLKLKSYIYRKITNKKYLKLFKVIFADCLKPSSKMERQSTKPYISSKYKKIIKPVSDSFEYSFRTHLNALKKYNDALKPYNSDIRWISYDATNFNSVDNKIDLAITSPPYLTAFDYTQIIKIESAWIDTLEDSDIEILRNKQVGHEKRRHSRIHESVFNAFQKYYNKLLSTKNLNSISTKVKIAKTCLSYFNDIYNNLNCVKSALKKGGEYHMVIGDNVIKGVEIPTHKIIANLGNVVGLKWVGYYKYLIKDHRTSIPRKGNGGKIEYEYVIILRK
jgi:DNA modification methylase